MEMNNTVMSAETGRRHRPIGVTIMAILLGLVGIIELLLGVGALIAFLALGHQVVVHGGHRTAATVINTIGLVITIIPILSGFFTLLFSLGLWMLWRWAYWATIIVEAGTLIFYVVRYFQHVSSIPSIAYGMVIPVVILVYFLAVPQVRAAFRVGNRRL